MSIIEKTWKIVDQFTEDPKHVRIDDSDAKALRGTQRVMYNGFIKTST